MGCPSSWSQGDPGIVFLVEPRDRMSEQIVHFSDAVGRRLQFLDRNDTRRSLEDRRSNVVRISSGARNRLPRGAKGSNVGADRRLLRRSQSKFRLQFLDRKDPRPPFEDMRSSVEEYRNACDRLPRLAEASDVREDRRSSPFLKFARESLHQGEGHVRLYKTIRRSQSFF